jgi:ankyrin repeat protein
MKSPKAIEIALKKLPKGSNAYDYAYDEAMERIKGQAPACQKTAEWTLKWITFARRQLSVPELQHALAVEVGETEFDACNISRKAYILSICAGLVTVDEESNIIRLVHYTTQEYFERTRHDLFENAEADLSKVCVSYLSFRSFDSGPCLTFNGLLERLELNKFYDYSAKYWGHHAREASSLCPEVTDFLNCEPKVDASSQALLNYGSHNDARFVKNPRMTGLHLASFFGIGEAIKTMLQQGVEINAADQEGRTPLSRAAGNGHELVVKLLLDRGPRLETKDDVFGQTPLSVAAQNGHDLVVKLLLDKGADPETKKTGGQTPLLLAAKNGYDLVVKLLLDKGAGLETKGYYGQTPLLLAAENGRDLVVKLLLDKGADPERKDNYFRHTPLSFAAKRGHDLVVKLLLDKGADPETKD